MPDTRPIVPKLPEVGYDFIVFGIRWTTTVVEPASDYVWQVEAKNAKDETAIFLIPTDVRTTP